MSYTDKPMKMQWITVNGQSVPLVLPQYWDGEKWVISSEQNPLPVKAELTGSKIELLLNKTVVSSNTSNLFFGSSINTAASITEGLDVRQYKGLSIFLQNNTDDSFSINNIYQGISTRPGSERIFYKFGAGINISSGSNISISFDTNDEDYKEITNYLRVQYPYFIFSINNPTGIGNGDVRVIIMGKK